MTSPDLDPPVAATSHSECEKEGAVPHLRSTGMAPSRYEKVFVDGGSTGVAIAEAARSARSHLGHQGKSYDTAAAIGTQCIGMSMAAFLLWVRANCESENIDQAIFLARDGELPLKMAEAMPADYWELSLIHI